MTEQLSISCFNCGARLDMPRTVVSKLRCPVCQYENELVTQPRSQPVTSSILETNISNVVALARAGGLERDAIVRVLRDELEFAAELASPGRNMTVQIIDLGPLEAQSSRPAIRERSDTLRGRAVGR